MGEGAAGPVLFKDHTGREFHVTESQILDAMESYDREQRINVNDSGKRFAVFKKGQHGKSYPPKEILRIATNAKKFSGGPPTNRVFEQLGFTVRNFNPVRARTLEEIAAENARLDSPIPEVTDLLEELFTKRWRPLEECRQLPDFEYPGVYVLAYPDESILPSLCREPLLNQTIQESDVFYVGVSHIAIRKRIGQFRGSIERFHGHSAGNRFAAHVAGGLPYSGYPHKKPFYVASISIPCRYRKNDRQPQDLRKLGVASMLELFVLARVKEKTGSEPWLNKK